MAEVVAVIGGGITGVQAALDLAAAGMEVHLIERSPSLGGHMAQLDKTFPTNDCSTCILSPKLVEAYRHPSIRVWTKSEVVGLEGDAPRFRLTVRCAPRYVKEDLCVGCGECARRCPVTVGSEFEMGIGERRAIYIPFAQAVPLKYSIDPGNCLRITKGRCGVCQKICPADAIDFDMKPRSHLLEVGAVIVATGFDQYDPGRILPYRYAEADDVVTSLEFERLLSPSGPTGGKLLRRDGSAPRSLVFVQCAGSRDINHCSHCSRFCCMGSLKQAIVALEHEPSLERIAICFMDMRTYGKEYDRYRERAMSRGIELIRGRVSEVLVDPLMVRMEEVEAASVRDLAADMVILAMAAVPSRGTKELAEVLGIDLAEDGFILTKATGRGALVTTREGVFAAGCCTGPKDIPDSVCEASGAASLVLSLFPGRKAKVPKRKKLRDVSNQEPRVGVFVCRCGTNIAATVNVPSVVSAASNMDRVIHAEESMFSCSEGALEEIARRIEEEGINRVVIASCTPRTHEPLFRSTLENAGLNPYLLEMANIRDQCSWVHQDSPDEATRKAIDLVRSAVAKVVRLEPLEPETSEVVRSAAIVGGGGAGLSAARDLLSQGFEVYLIEKGGVLGGRLNEIHMWSDSGSGTELLSDLLESTTGLEVILEARIESVTGSVGDFRIRLEGGRELEVGAVILTPGAELASERSDGCMTSSELEGLMRRGEPLPRRVAFIQCVGVRNERYGCSRFCCSKTLQQARELAMSGSEVSVLHRDVMSYQRGAEELYREVSSMGVRFYEAEAPELRQGRLAFTSITDGEVEISVDMVVLATGMVPSSSNRDLGRMFKVPFNREGFFMEKHPKLAPVEFAVDGVFVAGCAQYPKDLAESMVQGSAAAAKAAGLLSKRILTTPAQICVVDEARCRGCGVCESLCNYGAASIRESAGRVVSVIEAKMCKGCGVCAVSCPSNAIAARGFTTEQIEAQIEAILGGE